MKHLTSEALGFGNYFGAVPSSFPINVSLFFWGEDVFVYESSTHIEQLLFDAHFATIFDD